MSNPIRVEAERILNRMELRYGPDLTLRKRLLPIVLRILESAPPTRQRADLLRLVARSYAHHMRMRTSIDELKMRLRQRINEVYGQILGIEPPGLSG